ncbi:MAG: DUF3365 domain-containing protein [Chloroflexaceae bacterium]|nr:DUF3365 domain-containing protein [Chloroflexaceae bacterium]
MRTYQAIIISGLLSLVVLAACIVTESPNQARQQEREEQVRKIGQEVAGTLGKELLQKVKTAMEEKGPVDAFEFCSTRAQTFTNEIEARFGEGIRVKRTSFQYRNPLNAPDGDEEEALRFFEEALQETQSLPEDYIQRVSSKEYRYYRPLRMGKDCLICHGDPADFSPALLENLERYYPEDLATGYEEGDFRGVIRVSIPASNLE